MSSDKYMRTLRRMALDRTLDVKTAETLLRAHIGDAEWREGDHPRGKGGKFVSKGSGSFSGASEGSKKSGGSSSTMKEPSSPFLSHRAPSMRAGMNMKSMEKAKRSMAEECARQAKQWPEGSGERHMYETYAESMSKPFVKRPTSEESKALTSKFLGNISSKLKPYAVDRYKKDLSNEPQITNDLCDIADEVGTGMFGLEYRLKKASDSSDGRCRIDDKIAEDMKDKGWSYEEAVDGLSDMVRYTQACTTKNLVKNFERTKAALEKKGYKPVKIKNSWNTFDRDNPYRGVNCVFESPTGTRFELQFHTPESLVGKEVQHGWYEEYRNPDTKKSRKAELGERMYQNMARMKAPEGIENIQPYPPKKD